MEYLQKTYQLHKILKSTPQYYKHEYYGKAKKVSLNYASLKQNKNIIILHELKSGTINIRYHQLSTPFF